MLRVKVTDEFLEVTLSAQAAFSKRSWPFVAAMAVPWLLCAGQRSICRMASMGSLRRSASAYYRFLSEGKWRPLVLLRCLFQQIVRTFDIRELTLVLDDTLCPKWGRRIYGTSSYFDHVHRPRPGYIWGHNWVVLAVVVGAGKTFVALPFWIGLYRRQDSCTPGQFRTRHEMAAGVLTLVRALFPGPIRLLADGAYANDSLVARLGDLNIELVSRLRVDAALRAVNPPRRTKHQHGRRPKHGARLGRLSSLACRRSAFRRERVMIYGKSVELLLRDFEAYWPALGRVIKVVITQDPRRPRRRRAYLFTTDLRLSAIEIVESFAQRWTIEQLFVVAKNHMGLDTAEVRKERSVLRHATLCMALITWTEIWAYRVHPLTWARSFSQKLAWLRSETVTSTVFASGPRDKGSRRIAQGLGDLFTSATSAA